MSTTLNDSQLEILKLFSNEQTNEDLVELKSLLINYLSDKVVREADKSFEQKEYTTVIFENWKNDHFRKKQSL